MNSILICAAAFVALLAMAFRRMRPVAINSELPAPAVVTVGIPRDVDPEEVLRRKKALIEAGTEPLIAEKLAIDAAQQQAMRDKELKAVALKAEVPVTQTVDIVVGIPDGTDIESLTVAQLNEIAEKSKIDLQGATKKADLVAAIRKATTPALAIVCALFLGFFGSTAQAVTMPMAAPQLADLEASRFADAAASQVVAASEFEAPLIAQASAVDLIHTRWGIVSAIALALAAGAYLPRRFRRRIAINATMTPLETSRGTESLDGTAAITFKNALVTKSAAADDRHFLACNLVTDIPYGILLNDELATAEIDVVKKNIAILGLYKESLPAVAAAAITVNDRLVADLATPGRVKKIPTASGTYIVIGRARFTVANAGDPVSIAHCSPYTVVVP